ncbi:MAG: hypothetical protein AVDCRST_MAG40-2244, partial [uncultured Gemmatimonadaceae bacterium]
DVREDMARERERERLLAAERAARVEAEAAGAQLQEQALELELANQQLQDQATELELQAEELQTTAAQLEERTEAAERAGKRAVFLAEASRLLGSSLDPAATLQHLADLAVPALADWCGIDVVHEATGALEQVAVAHADPARVAWARQVRRDYPAPPDAPMGAPAVARTGRAEFYPEVTDAMLAASARDAAHLALMRELGLTSAVIVPLVARGRTLGALSLVAATPERRFTPDDLALAEEVGRRAGLALDNARLHAAAEAARADADAARRAADEANQAKSAFLATMSHELRTPVNAVIGYAQLLELGLAGPLTEQQRGYLGRLARSGQHLLGLVNDVLDLSKIEAGETRVAHEDSLTGPAVRAALDVVAPVAAQRGVRIVDARPDDDGVPFVGDEGRVRQVILNLLSNAVKFTASGGTVTVTCDTVRAAPPAAAHLRGEGPWALVRVEDTGVGIAPEEQGRIFEEFHQVDGGHTRTAGGTGLGLAISRRLARLMGGDLTVESAPGAGSAFTLWLPAARAPHAGGAQETAAERAERAERDLGRLETPGLAEVGELLHGSVNAVIAAYTDRLRADPAIPRGAAMTRIQLEDHAISFLADLAQSLVIVGDAGPEAADLLRDGSAIQRTIAEAHGARRHAQGWDAAALGRDQQIFREEVELAVRAGLKAGSGDVDAAVDVLLGLIDRGQGIAAAAWRRAAAAAAQ